jgi:Helix-turn-helix domain
MSKGRKGRSPDQIRKDRAEIAALYLQGHTQRDIGVKLGLSRQQVGYDLDAVRREWLQSSLMDFNARKAEELARINRLEQHYWAAWEASKKERQTSTTEQTTGADGERLKAGIRKEEQTGEARYLAGVQWCISKRCEILGLDAPKKIAPTTPDGREPYRLTVEDFTQARNRTEEWRRERFGTPEPGTN